MKKVFIAVLVFLLYLLAQANIFQVQAMESLQGGAKIDQLSSDLILTGDSVIQVSVGGVFSGALTQTGKVFTWGANESGQLGDNTNTTRLVPIEITSQFNLTAGDKIIKIEFGYRHAFAISETGKVFSWGANENGQLGDNSYDSKLVPTNITSRFNLTAGDKVIQLSAAVYSSLALTESGRVFSWGSNYVGELGDNSLTPKRVPTEITSLFSLSSGETITSISMGYSHGMAVSGNGKIFTWGSNGSGQLGDTTFNYRNVPVEITSRFSLSSGDKVVQMSAGIYHSGAVTQNGSVFTWGDGSFGQLGDNTTSQKSIPTDITSRFTFTSEDMIQEIDFGFYHCSAVSINGSVFTWGYNNAGQLGINSTTNSLVPVAITSRFSLPSNDQVIQLSLGFYHSSALTLTGKVYTWGYNSTGQLGDNTTTNQLVPKSNASVSTPSAITLSFHSNGGSAVDDINEFEGTTIFAPTEPTRSGYTFGGWYSDVGLTTTYTFSTMPAQNTTVYAKWTPVSYAISYQLNDGSNHANNPTTYHIETPTIVLATPTKTGYSFGGWYDNAAFTGSAVTQIALGSTADKTLYAKWTINQYTITFEENGGTAIAAIRQDYNTSITAPANPTRIGHTFIGWSQAIPATMPSENITINALWSINQYTITFDTTGGSAINPITLNFATPFTAPANPTRDGYSFAGWGQTIPSSMLAFNQTITALWTINQYTITFNANDGSAVDAITQDYNTQIIAPSNPTKLGYAFGGWYSDLELATAFAFSTMPSSNTTVYAKWTPVSYAINYHLNAGTNHANNPATYHFETPTIQLAAPTKVGHVFGGWYDNAEFTGSSVTQIALGSTGDKTLYAKWTINQYIIVFEPNGGSGVAQIIQDYNTSITAPSNPTRTGYTFSGWSQAVPTTMPAENLTITAQWTINQYTITFNANGGSAIAAITQDYNTSITAPSNPTRTGYTINGWSQAIPSTMPAENLTITALWTINPYTITFNANGGSAIASITQDYNTAITAPSNPTRTGYIFNGWSQAVPAAMPAGNLTIQAHWILNTQDTGNVQTETEAIHDKLDPSLVEGKDVEIVIRVEVQPQTNILPAEVALINDTIQNALDIRRSGSLFVNIEIILKEQGLADVLIQELLAPISITIRIPEEYRGYKNYHVIRIHNGVAEVLETEYHQDNQTLTFETDRFSTYVIAYDVSSGSGLWWLLLLLIVPIAYLVYRQTKKTVVVDPSIDATPQTEVLATTEPQPEVQEEIVILEEVVIKNIEERPQFKAFEAVDNGDYLEITTQQEASNRVVEVSTGVLPKLINPDNTFVLLEKEEVAQFKELDLDLATYHRLTPGSYTDPGYFMEVDLDSKSVENFVHVKRRLPPTSAKGHRWVRIEPRKIKSE
jgi:uncharacterized repeat protein (TIGR02543 family)